VDKALFELVQKRLTENQSFARRNTKYEYLLTGLLRHRCGRNMGARTCRGTLYYYCFGTNKSKAPINAKGEPQTCNCYWVNAKMLEETVWEMVTGLLRNPARLIKELEDTVKTGSVTRKTLEEELDGLKKRLEQIPAEQQRLVEGYRRGLYAEFMMREEMERLSREQADTDRRRLDLESQLARLGKVLGYRDQLEAFAKKLDQGVDSMGFREKRDLLKLVIEQITFDNWRITVKAIIPLEQMQLHPVSGWQG
jgi:hypothetical protein